MDASEGAASPLVDHAALRARRTAPVRDTDDVPDWHGWIHRLFNQMVQYNAGAPGQGERARGFHSRLEPRPP